MKRAFVFVLTIALSIVCFPTIASADIKRLSEARVSNIALPEPFSVVKDYKDTTVRPDDANEKYNVANEECYWSDSQKNKLSENAVFEKGHEYYYSVKLKAVGNYVFNTDAKLKISGGSVAPDAQVISENAGKEITFKNVFKYTCGVGQVSTIASISLSKYIFYYDGKEHKPTVKVLDGIGKTVSSSNYTVKYSSSGPKKVGIYDVTVTGKELATGSVSATFQINPSVPRSVKASSGKEKIKVNWSAPKSGKPGFYNIFVYSDKACKKVAQSATVDGQKKSTTIRYLKKATTYFVKVDCYKFVNGEKLVSKMSSAKKVRTN